MKPLTTLIIVLGILSFNSGFINATCSLNLNIFPPKIVSRFGSKNLLRPFEPVVTRELSRTVDLYCANGFTMSSYHVYQITDPHLQLICDHNGFTKYLESHGSEVTVERLECADSQSLGMYESRTALPDCEDFMTLVVGFDFGELGSLKNVAICYDIVKQQLKYISYTAYPTNLIEKTQEGQLDRLGLDVGVTYSNSMFKQISTLDITNGFSKDKQLKLLFGEETFEYQNLIQDMTFKSDLSTFENMLSIVWLRALRNGNWKHLLNALQKANLNGKYDVRVGVSGVVSLPMLQNCNETRQLTIDLENGDTVSVPAHIWAHIRALQPSLNGTDEFVVVAHNSPFITNNERLGLCSSICEQVDWLKDTLFSKLQHYPVYGIIQCCRLSDVEDKLDNFPTSADIIRSVG
ncbi:uncharacterized protein LOC117789364 isoform X1 [Drosophila innubila]|uniref:uncharacterized protein LOC117789364 isoform X1 n=1 Tax=Drosophila innubila TaxID=198719 RepID=UPI00148E7573|nr:uncharacterized protein LOC117789364 isoform X1 [Drosophila innubila]